MTEKSIKVGKKVLNKNDLIAAENRQFLAERKLRCINIMGSVGSGKTSILERFAERLGKRMFVINGDCTTTIDADRIEQRGAKTFQINTGKGCHLDANQIRSVLTKEDHTDIETVFIENVGNLICPAEFDLGQDFNVTVISVSEGPWVVKKHPQIFRVADYVVVNKTDLAEPMEIDPEALVADVKIINPRATTVLVSAKHDRGIDDLLKVLEIPS